MKNRLLLMTFLPTLLTLITIRISGAQEERFNLTDILTPDTAITIGRLDNGLTFYIKENKKPEKRAELRLVVKRRAR
jgi:zinc protease